MNFELSVFLYNLIFLKFNWKLSDKGNLCFYTEHPGASKCYHGVDTE
jgi:hypothetical protein